MAEESKIPENDGPVTLDEPGPEETAATAERKGVWLRLLFMIIFAVLFGIAETILAVGAVLQFGFLLFTGKRNESIADFGVKLADWMRDVARFQTVVTEDKPFPFSGN
ncbi:DUF4389 domain-containing protein [Thalassovita aquimarina]|uniref:DUF4389 domain-containing protein n=1 Tax=Thalassovita aquimarina TaxID=2785917 RepID=A0ABS5HYV3_9RHOB|nr:DUF4389 domain-containing protein [Thalassovita aquimarina]MBR9653568.1 DUF4389 domain-containing protein [Thalassovita aquimarina]